LLQAVDHYQARLSGELFGIAERLDERMARTQALLASTRSVLAELNPATVLERGYAILRGDAVVGQTIKIETLTKEIEAEVRHVRQK
jgi:exonuclease VII large subunit